MCEEGKAGEEEGTWIYEKIEFESFADCHAEVDSQIAAIYIVVLALIGLKFFFVHILHLWYKEIKGIQQKTETQQQNQLS